MKRSLQDLKTFAIQLWQCFERDDPFFMWASLHISILIWPIIPPLARANGLCFQLTSWLNSPHFAVATLLQSPQQPWEFAKQLHWGYHSAVLNSQTSFPHGPYASQACHFTVLQTQHGFTLAWFCTCGSLCQERSPSLLCPTKEGPLHSGKPWAGRQRPFTLGQQGRSSTLESGAPRDGAPVSGRPAD